LIGQPGELAFAQSYEETHSAFGKPIRYVYFLRVGRRIKIATTRDLKARFSSLRYAISNRSYLTYAVRGDVRQERELHGLFAADHIRGDWFRYFEVIKAWIASDKERKQHAGRTSTGIGESQCRTA
jgi:hypothetical protein